MPYTVVYYIDSDSFGGAEQVLYTVLKGLDRSIWHPVLAYHPSPGISPFIKLIDEFNITKLETPKIKNYRDLSGILTFTLRLRAIRPAIFHANINWPLSCSEGIIAAYLARVRIIVATQHLYQELTSHRLRFLQKLISLFVNCYIAISSDLSNQLKNETIPTSKIRIIQNGIDLSYYGRASYNKADKIYAPFKKDKNIPVILTVARLAEQKGHTYLLKAATRVQEALFILAGDGPERKELEDETRRLNLADRVIFLGARKDIPVLLKGCDIYVQPSLFEGGLALSIMEAMAACKPVIATDVEGVRKNVIDGENAVLVPPADSEALTKAINTLLSDSNLANHIATSGRLLVFRNFSAKRMVKDLTDLYKELLSDRNGEKD